MRFNKLLKIVWQSSEGHRPLALLMTVLYAALAGLESLSITLIYPVMRIFTGSPTPTNMTGEWGSALYNLIDGENPVLSLAIFFCLLTAVRFMARVYADFISAKLINNLRLQWRQALFQRYLQSPINQLSTRRHGEMINNLFSEAAKAGTLMYKVVDVIHYGLVVLSMLFLLWNTSVSLTLLGAAGGGIVYAFIYVGGRKILPNLSRERVRISQNVTSHASESLSHIRQIKAAVMEKHVISQYVKMTNEEVDNVLRLTLWNSFFGNFLLLGLAGLGVAMALYLDLGRTEIAAWLPIIGVMALGAQKILNAASTLISAKLEVFHLIPSLEAVLKVLDSPSPKENIDSGKTPPTSWKSLQLEGISFKHTEAPAPIIHQLNFSFQSPGLYLVRGPSGVGKSTLLDLLCAFILPSTGSIRVNGEALGTLSLAAWRKQIGLVSQETLLFRDTIRENLIAGQASKTDQEIWVALQKAGCREFVSSLPGQLDYTLVDRGQNLSGGQRQRLSIARAILRSPNIYLFDEATSALDAEAENTINQTILQLSKEALVVVVTHRPNNFPTAASLVMDQPNEKKSFDESAE